MHIFKQKLDLKIFLFVIFITNLSPFFLFNKSLSFDRIGKLLLLFIFVKNYLFLKKGSCKIKKFLEEKDNKRIAFSLLVLIIIQSLSIIEVKGDIKPFLFRIENIIFSYILFFDAIVVLTDRRKIDLSYKILIFSFVVQIAVPIIALLTPELFKQFLIPFIHPSGVNLIQYNIERGRFYFENYNFIIIPFFIFKLFDVGLNYKTIYILFFLLILLFVAIISGFRTTYLLTVFSIVFSLYFIPKLSLFKKNLLMFVLLFFTFLLSSSSIYGYKPIILERLLLSNEADRGSIVFRLNMCIESIYMGTSNIFGVGLGNFYNNLPAIAKKIEGISSPTEKDVNLQTKEYPHNAFCSVLAETGIFGFLSFSLLILLFLRSDLIVLIKRNQRAKQFVISFWLLFIYSLFNPGVGARYNEYLWLMRAYLICSV